jgi:hypothetical protein
MSKRSSHWAGSTRALLTSLAARSWRHHLAPLFKLGACARCAVTLASQAGKSHSLTSSKLYFAATSRMSCFPLTLMHCHGAAGTFLQEWPLSRAASACYGCNGRYSTAAAIDKNAYLQAIMRAVGKVVYLPGVRDLVVQAQYFKAPFEQETYLASNLFLPDVNQEREGHEKKQYKQNLVALDTLALIRFKADTTGAALP